MTECKPWMLVLNTATSTVLLHYIIIAALSLLTLNVDTEHKLCITVEVYKTLSEGRQLPPTPSLKWQSPAATTLREWIFA